MIIRSFISGAKRISLDKLNTNTRERIYASYNKWLVLHKPHCPHGYSRSFKLTLEVKLSRFNGKDDSGESSLEYKLMHILRH